jgi:putative DNA primase/helicase
MESGEFKPHSPDHLSTVQSQTSFEPGDECSLWLQTVKEILPDPESQRLLSQIFGYCLTPDNSHQKGFIFYGDGANGKSVITDVLETLAGSENCSALHLGDFKERFRLAELQNKLINFSTEVEAKGLVDDARIKGIISGDPLTAERKNQQPFVFRPFVKLIVSCNNLPQTTDKSYGYFRRWVILPFTQTFSTATRDRRRAKTIIETELSGVLNWAIGGYKSLKDMGTFIEPKASTEAHEKYRRQIDPSIEFVDEQLRILDGSTGSPMKEILKKYQAWTQDNGIQALGRNNFYKALERATKRKITKNDDTGARYLPGVFLL